MGKYPDYPDPFKTAQSQMQANQGTAISQQLLNMTNQVGPWGSMTYNQTGTNTYTNPFTGKQETLPQFTQTTQYSPEQQALYDKYQQFQGGAADLGLNRLEQVSNMGKFDYNPGEHEQWAGNLYNSLNADSNAQERESMTQRLANQGLQPGSAAYDDAMRSVYDSQHRSRDEFGLNSYQTGFNTALTEHNQVMNEALALAGQGQVQQPVLNATPTTGVNGVDYAGLVDRKFQAEQAAAQAKMGGLFGLGSTLLGGMFSLSDKRTKENIKHIGTLKDGTKIHSYNYKPEFGGLFSIGVMADDAQKKHPDAVKRGDDGYLRVNYSKLAEELAA